MVVYMYLAILIVTSIITGIIVTIMERKGFYPKKNKKVKAPVKKETEDPIIMSAVTVMNMEPIEVDSITREDFSDSPVLLSSYTVDLSDVVNKAKTEGCV